MNTDMNMDVRQSNILARLKNAETDRNNFIYFSVNYGYCIFKVNKQHLDNITQHLDNITQDGVAMYLYRLPKLYKYTGNWYENNWYENSFVWLHTIYNIYTIEETKLYTWGKSIEPKRYYSLYRVVLLKLFIQSYINDLRHRMWHPDSIHVKKLEEHFISLIA